MTKEFKIVASEIKPLKIICQDGCCYPGNLRRSLHYSLRIDNLIIDD